MSQIVAIALGGALGSVGRFLFAGWVGRVLGVNFPWGTLAVNLIGSFLAGFLVIWLEGRGPSAVYWRAFLIVGMMGGLTTFSALMVECMLFARSDRSGLVPLYLAVSLVAGLLLVWLGSRAAEMFRPPF